jgi:hypothetical protein
MMSLNSQNCCCPVAGAVVGLLLPSNNLVGDIREFFEAALAQTIQYIWLRANALRGSIPAGITGFKDLMGIHIGSNLLQGQLPDVISNLTRLQALVIHNNSLTGSLPASILQPTSSLQTIHLDINQIQGSVPMAALFSTVNLLTFTATNNKMSGSLTMTKPLQTAAGGPPVYRKLQNVDLSGNDLTGEDCKMITGQDCMDGEGSLLGTCCSCCRLLSIVLTVKAPSQPPVHLQLISLRRITLRHTFDTTAAAASLQPGRIQGL